MSKSLVEMTAAIVAGQAKLIPLSSEAIAESLHAIFQELQAMKQLGSRAALKSNVPRSPQSSIQRHQVVCLECGNTFQLLSNRHLALHSLTPREYKQKHGIRMAQALSAQTLSARRRKLAKQLGMGKQLAAWHAKRKRQAG